MSDKEVGSFIHLLKCLSAKITKNIRGSDMNLKSSNTE